MRYLIVLFAILILTVSSISQVKLPGEELHPDSAYGLQATSVDSALQFLLTSAASDFHTHTPEAQLFRDVHFGHSITSEGKAQYMLCGWYLQSKTNEWAHFVTIKTSGYEQWLGGTSEGFCQDSSFTLDREEDLSPLLQSQVEALR